MSTLNGYVSPEKFWAYTKTYSNFHVFLELASTFWQDKVQAFQGHAEST